MRKQLLVDDKQWLKRMSSHHSTALTTSHKIYNRTNINDFKINEQIYSTLGFEKLGKNIFPNTLIINCTSLGAVENFGLVSEKILENVKVFYDLNYPFQ